MQYGNCRLTILIAPQCLCLNRTMQYGNFSSAYRMFCAIFRLNRTMQYGNFFDFKNPRWRGVQFKSYYVVWKLYSANDVIGANAVFKSYYVVWKLSLPRVGKRSCGLFKSYYVVWKRCAGKKRFNRWHSLNRTMQYGNY